MKREELQQKLTVALACHSLVRIERKLESGAVDGYVVGCSAAWLIMLVIGEGVFYGGFQAFRLQDISH